MRFTTLGHSDLKVSALIFGGVASDEQTAHAMLDAAFEAGITTFDTPSHGGEEWVGRWMAARGNRDQVIVSITARHTARPLREQVETALRRLRTDHIDLCLPHSADGGAPVEETVAALDDLIRAGKIRHYGVSSQDGQVLADTVAAAWRAGAGRPVAMRGAYHLLDRGHETLALPASEPYGVGFTAAGPLAGGLLTGRGGVVAELPPGIDRAMAARTIERLTGLAARRGATPATLALAWVLSAPQVSAAVIAPRTRHHLDELSAALEVRLTREDRAWLASGEM